MSELYLVWSNEHRAWWAPGECGYTIELDRAGRYTRERAIAICRRAMGGWRPGTPFNELAIKERDAIEGSRREWDE